MRRRGGSLLFAMVALALACGDPAEGGNGGGGGGGGAGGSSLPGKPTCTSDGACSWNEICVEGFCARLCARHGECPLGEHCLEIPSGARACGVVEPGDECERDRDCASDEICVAGRCIPDSTSEGCLAHQECAFVEGYCAAVETGTDCVSMACGTEFNDCGLCALGPNGGARSAAGPVLFDPRQLGGCVANPTTCPEFAPWWCEFGFAAYDPDGGLPEVELAEHLFLVGPDGSFGPAWMPTATILPGQVVYRFRSCFADTGDGSVRGAVFLVDRHGNHSQTLCFTGEAPGD